MTQALAEPGARPASPRKEAPAMLEAVELSKSYGAHRALDRLSLQVFAGEIFCMLGANGAGKTTTVNLFLNFIQPSSGVARIAGLDVIKHPLETKRHVAYIPEQVRLYENLTGLENLEYFAALADRGALAREELLRALREAGLPGEAAERRVGGYSKGMRQKVGIALAIVKRADVLLLDEPTSGLDPKASNEFSELMLAMSARGAAVFMVTHDIFRAKETGHRVGIMKHGRLVELLSTGEIGHADLERLYLQHMHD